MIWQSSLALVEELGDTFGGSTVSIQSITAVSEDRVLDNNSTIDAVPPRSPHAPASTQEYYKDHVLGGRPSNRLGLSETCC